jgi:hypothetical protein
MDLFRFLECFVGVFGQELVEKNRIWIKKSSSLIFLPILVVFELKKKKLMTRKNIIDPYTWIVL